MTAADSFSQVTLGVMLKRTGSFSPVALFGPAETLQCKQRQMADFGPTDFIFRAQFMRR